MKRVFFLTAAVSSLALAACGETPSDNTAAAPSSPTATATAAPSATVPAVFTSNPIPEGVGEEFLTAMAALEGTQTTANGLVLQTFEEGTGNAPAPNDLVRINFIARSAGQTEPFESSYENAAPVVLDLSSTLRGWSEALQLMKAGGKARAALPASLAFGDQGMPGGPVGPGEVTVYDLELLEIFPATDDAALTNLVEQTRAKIEEYTAAAAVQQGLAQQQFVALQSANLARSNLFLTEVAQRPGIQATPSGLLYEVISDEGEGDVPTMGETVRVHYRGTVPSGEVFDSSYDRGAPAEFVLGQVIQGWNEGLQLMNPGDSYRFYIPPALAYGQQGTRNALIGPNQALVFDVELLAVTPAPAEESAE